MSSIMGSIPFRYGQEVFKKNQPDIRGIVTSIPGEEQQRNMGPHVVITTDKNPELFVFISEIVVEDKNEYCFIPDK